MADFPAELSTGMVHGRFIVAVIDGEDEGQDPDVVPAQGKIAFKASVGYIPVPVTTGGPVTVMKGPIIGVLDVDGYLCTPHPTTGEPMYRGVRLISTDDPDMAVTDWTWSADYRLEAVNGNSMQIPAHSFALPSGSELDLTTLVKVPSSPGYGLPQAEAAVLRAEAAAQVALDVKAMADAGEFDGVQGLPGNATMRVDTTVGTRVFITNGTIEHMIKGDTGWRNVGSLLINGWTTYVYPPRIKREGNVCEFRAYLRRSTATSPTFMGNIPGFGASFGNIPAHGLASGTADLRPSLARVDPPGFGVPDYLGMVQAEIYVHIIWTTTDPWPTTLPGIPL